ncbi:hypothetical protein ACQEVS_33120 [Streptomyces sp. CA-181903]|uniref:hypothetical protein n=1 Tax=Streptomyces sp. CA-181903 TaxID=3240055 RepID=UPI003D905D24
MSLPGSRVLAACAVAAGGCVLSWAGAAAGLTPGVLPAPQLKVAKAQADLCPTDAVTKALGGQRVTLGAESPAVLSHVDSRTCVRLPITRGEFAMDLSAGSVPADGGITFTDSTGRGVTFTDVTFDFGGRVATGTATTQGAAAGRASRRQSDGLFTLDFRLDKTEIDLTRGTAEGAATLGLGQGADAGLKEAFGSDPLAGQGAVFDATAGGDVSQAVLALTRALLP